MKAKLLAIIQAILIALVVLSGSIGAPILCRPFYYQHIVPLKLHEAVGLSVEQVKLAYDQMLDYCIGRTDTLAIGSLPFSDSAAAHFADVRRLFVLDLRVFAVGVVLLTALWLLGRKRTARLLGHTSGFWSAIGLGVTFLTVGALAASDFDRAFEVFHGLLFPGKDNWLFDSLEDPVILMLPAEFFANCAVAILVLLLMGCAGLLIQDFLLRRKK